MLFAQKKALGRTLILSEVGRTVQYRQSAPKGLLQNPDQGTIKLYSVFGLRPKVPVSLTATA
jgi:hypothetical protein